MLKIRQGYTLEHDGDCTWIYRDADHYLDAFAVIVSNGPVTWIGAYPHGNKPGKRFKTVWEAHVYLIENGSESPWVWEPSC